MPTMIFSMQRHIGHDCIRYLPDPPPLLYRVGALGHTCVVEAKLHNLVLVKPGARLEIVTAAALMGAAGMANSFVPKSDKVIAYTPLVLTGNTYKLYFKAPTNPGKYEYICTYPGHGLTMRGGLHAKEVL